MPILPPNATPEQCMNSAEQEMQNILENKADKLDAFLFDHSPEVDKHQTVKAFICFAQAYHYAIKALKDKNNP